MCIRDSSGFTALVSGYNDLNVTNVTTFAVNNLVPGSPYYYRVRAYTAAATSTNSNVITFTTLPASPAAPVAASATSITQFGFTANWSFVSGAIGYRLDVSTDGTFATFVTGYNNKDVVNVNSYAISGLSSGMPYYYRVRAYNIGGASVSLSLIHISEPTRPY